ncbi:hypothetical protein [Hymenobacter sp. BT730]|uniref:hypothetical protein n=1 Tax=Hymenobacter sp. BT730 TaxID=3063332 RepID=UPI0026DFC4C1|nr:hypothetical protein [Hymenobacter sp. BT730]
MKSILSVFALVISLGLIGFLYYQTTQLEQALQLADKRFADCQQVNFQLQMKANGNPKPDATPAKEAKETTATEPHDLLTTAQLSRLVSRGLGNPGTMLRTSLQRQQQRLLPAEGKVGGTMKIRDISVLSDHYALASFDDGHSAGQMLLRYEAKGPQQISWQRVDYVLE